MSSNKIDPRLREGIQLFNEGKFFESHEVIESLWLACSDDRKNFYKALIQAAAAFHLVSLGRSSGAARLFCSSLEYLDSYPDEIDGVSAKTFKDCLKVYSQAYDNALQQNSKALFELSVPKIDYAAGGTA